MSVNLNDTWKVFSDESGSKFEVYDGNGFCIAVANSWRVAGLISLLPEINVLLDELEDNFDDVHLFELDDGGELVNDNLIRVWKDRIHAMLVNIDRLSQD